MLKLRNKPIIGNIKGFTMSEVLLTIVILGIVAALTIPFVYGNYMYAVRSAKVKNFSKIMNNALEDALIENEKKPFLHIGPENSTEHIERMMKHLRPHLPIIEECGWETGGNCSFHGKYKPFYDKCGTMSPFSIDTDLYYKFNLSDGSHVYYFKNGHTYFTKNFDMLRYDMNGDKGPNRFGYDMFQFEIGDTHKMIPCCYEYKFGENFKEDDDCVRHWGGAGVSCAAKIMMNIKYYFAGVVTHIAHSNRIFYFLSKNFI